MTVKDKLKNVWTQYRAKANRPIQSQENKPYDRDVSGAEAANYKKPNIIKKISDSYTYGYEDGWNQRSKKGSNKIMAHSDRKIKKK